MKSDMGKTRSPGCCFETGVPFCLQFCEQLRQYLWPALLRNSLSPYREAFVAVTKLLASILSQQRLRAGLKVEIGAFFPLMLLRPLEADR